MASHTVDIAKLESLANTIAHGLETLLAEVHSRQKDESKHLIKYRCLAAQVRVSCFWLLSLLLMMRNRN